MFLKEESRKNNVLLPERSERDGGGKEKEQRDGEKRQRSNETARKRRISHK